MRRNFLFALVCAVLLPLATSSASAQSGADTPLPLRVVAADDALTAAKDRSAPAEELDALGAALNELCIALGYPERDTCLSIARNERWIQLDTPRCVFAAGRAMGCSARQIEQMANPG